MTTDLSNLATVIYRRTYCRADSGRPETFSETVERVVRGNTKDHDVSPQEAETLRSFMLRRAAGPAGRGWWASGAKVQEKVGGAALTNCWFLTSQSWDNFVVAQDLLMLGGGVGMSVEHRYTSKLPRVRPDVTITGGTTKDADFIVPDSREGWNELTRRVLESFFVTGRSFKYSTRCIRGAGEIITGFGGVASGPRALDQMVTDLCTILGSRAGKAVRPIDAADILCAIGQMVVSGNVRRSAILILGDPFDKLYLKAKRWDLGTLPPYRGMANFSVVCSDTDDLHPAYWKTYEAGEPFGIVNRETIQRYGRIGVERHDTATGVNPCGEATLEPFEPCNLFEIALPRLRDEADFIEAAKAGMRYTKRVALEHYHQPASQAVISRNHRVGIGLTGALASPLFDPKVLDRVYAAIQQEDAKYSQELNIKTSIRTTVIKPSGTMSKLFDCGGYEGIHAPLSRYFIQRVRFASNDPLVKLLFECGHPVQQDKMLDGSTSYNTSVVDFFVRAPDGFPVVDEGWGLDQQLATVLLAQRHWADQSVSSTIYYRREDISRIKTWLTEHIGELKTISFLLQSDHGFLLAPKEAISREQFEKFTEKIKPLDSTSVGDGSLPDVECEGGSCPIR